MNTPKAFKVGDTVYYDEWHGIGTVTEIYLGRVYVKWDDSWSSDIPHYASHELSYVHQGQAPSAPSCTCGGWTTGTHSHWCDNKTDSARRPTGLDLAHSRK